MFPIGRQPAQRPRRGKLLARRASVPGEGKELDPRRDLRPHILWGLGAPPVGDRDRVAVLGEVFGQEPDDLEDSPAEGLDHVEDAREPRVLDSGSQYAPRPEKTAGRVASRISMSRTRDQ